MQNTVSSIGTEARNTAPIPTDPGATQRVDISGAPIAPPRPAQPQQRPRTAAPRKENKNNRARQSSRKAAQKRRRQQTLFITLLAITGVLLISLIITMAIVWSKPEDDGLIRNNVYAAGVNLSNMTPEDARAALKAATGDTYSKLNMTVTVLDTTITLTPKETGASLDVDAVVQEAYNYGRTEELRGGSEYTISILPYLNLNTKYIRNMVDALGEKYSSRLKQPTVSITGTRPELTNEEIDISIGHQELTVFVGTAEYGLSTDLLYEQIMDAYEMNIFQVTGECSVILPDIDTLYQELETLHVEHCYDPVDAVINSTTYEVTPEVYGYGFDLENLKGQIAAAKHGDTIKVSLCYIEPDITEKLLSEDLFRDNLASYSSDYEKDTALLANLRKACSVLNGTIIKSGEIFSFNDSVGQPTLAKGYKSRKIYVGTELQDVVGGGVSQIASALYYCALKAELDIVSRTTHTYAPGFIDAGLDAFVLWGKTDFKFRNNTEYPIRLQATVQDGYIQIELIGTVDKEYTVEIAYEVNEVMKPTTLVHTMLDSNYGGYDNGDVLVEGIEGCDVSTYICKYDKTNGNMISKDLKSRSIYEKRNELIVQIEIPAAPTEPSTEATVDPTENSTDPTATE